MLSLTFYQVMTMLFKNISQAKLIVMADGEEEKPIADNERLDELHIEDDDKTPQKKIDEISSDEVFICLDKAIIRDAVSYTMKWGKKDNEVITWNIVSDSDFVKADDDPLSYPDVVEFGFEENDMDDPTDFFSNNFFQT
jgi:hypothetical protein